VFVPEAKRQLYSKSIFSSSFTTIASGALRGSWFSWRDLNQWDGDCELVQTQGDTSFWVNGFNDLEHTGVLYASATGAAYVGGRTIRVAVSAEETLGQWGQVRFCQNIRLGRMQMRRVDAAAHRHCGGPMALLYSTACRLPLEGAYANRHLGLLQNAYACG
jgi:hypothetical protein